jgi:hypothetical protein
MELRREDPGEVDDTDHPRDANESNTPYRCPVSDSWLY